MSAPINAIIAARDVNRRDIETARRRVASYKRELEIAEGTLAVLVQIDKDHAAALDALGAEEASS